MTDHPTPEEERRSIEVEVEVPGTPEQVWEAIATGPGVSSWFVPHRIEEREGGAVWMSFGPGQEGEGTVTAWDPPHRIAHTSAGEGLAFEFLVEARDGGSCVVRLVNSGFGSGEGWDEMYDGMSEGWVMFLENLRLHLRHFAGRPGAAALPGAMWSGPRDEAWSRLLAELDLPAAPTVGDRIDLGDSGPRPWIGTVAGVGDHRLHLVLEQPTPATAFLAAEGTGEMIGMSAWSYSYGPDAEAVAAADAADWSEWLSDRGAGSG